MFPLGDTLVHPGVVQKLRSLRTLSPIADQVLRGLNKGQLLIKWHQSSCKANSNRRGNISTENICTLLQGLNRISYAKCNVMRIGYHSSCRLLVAKKFRRII